MYLLKLAFRPWRRAFFSQLGSVTALSILLFVGGLVLAVEKSFTPLIQKLGERQVVTAFLNPALDPAQEIKVVDSIKLSLGARAESVTDFKYIGNEEFLEDLKNYYPDLASQVGELGTEAHLMIPRYVSFQAPMSESDLKSVKEISGVETVETSKNRYAALVSALTAVRWVIRIVGAGLIVALFMSLFHLARVNVSLQESALSMLSLMGASPSKQDQVHILTGASVGFVGALMGAGFWSFVGNKMLHMLSSVSPALRDISGQASIFSASATLVAIGVFAGALAGWFASRTARVRI